jgi:hypothetical protein
MALESEAHFLDRALAVGLSRESIDKVKAQGWTTMGRFAFAIGRQPGNYDEESFNSSVVTPALGESATRGEASMLMRLHFEAFTLIASDMKSRVERTDEDPPRKLPRVERETRLAIIRERLPGADISEERVPAPSVIDAFTQMADDNHLRFYPWNKTVSAKFEAVEGKTSREWKPNKIGIISERIVSEGATQEIGHDLLKLEHVMIRRGIAMEVARLLPMEAHRDISNKWFAALEDDPADPDSYAKTTIAQIHKADAEVFRMLGNAVKTGLARRPDGVYPLESHVATVLASARIQQILQPLLRADDKREKPKETDKSKTDQVTATLKSMQEAAAQAVAQALKKRGRPGGASDQSKSKGKGKGARTPRPKELLNMDVTTRDGEPLCYAFNLDGCDKAAPGERCAKGHHLCARKGCQKAHSQRNHK